MARPRKIALDVSSTKPVAPPVWLPSMITRTCALLPSIAAVEFGTEVISVGVGESWSGYLYGTATCAWLYPSMSTVVVMGGKALASVIVQSWVAGSKPGTGTSRLG